MLNIPLDDNDGGYSRELRIRDERDARVSASGDPIECARCGIELGDGPNKCRRAVGTDVCRDCIIELDPPCEPDEDLRGAPIEESPSFRDAMRDSGRWP